MTSTGDDAEVGRVKEDIPHGHLFRVTGLSSNNLQKMAQASEPTADFEQAIAATGYGKFNILLMLCTLPAFWSAVSVTSSTSYIFTNAQCDMQLSLLDMGTVNAITYGANLPMVPSAINHNGAYILYATFAILCTQKILVPTSCLGMISSALIWGFLSDTLGRKRVMVFGFFGAGLVETAAAMSQNFGMLLVTRFMSGFMFNGPFAILISYIAEMHRTELRAKVILLTNLFFTLANTTLPLLAWAMLTNKWDFYGFGDLFVIHSWNLFLLATAMMPLLSGLVFLFMPESPKFLMSRGRNDEALEVFRKMYRMNTGCSSEDYPINKLVEEKSEKQGEGMEALKGGCSQLAPLFKVPHLTRLILICFIHSGCMFGSNTIRLWYPQLAAMISSESNQTLCSAIAPAPIPDEFACRPLETDMLTYLQSAIVGAGSILTYSIGGVIVNRCGKRLVAAFCMVCSAGVILLIPFFGEGPASVVTMVTLALAVTSLGGASLSSINVELFPTALRVMAMATFFMSGRVGTISGTVTFPVLVGIGCYPPFITIAAILAVCGLACLVLPNTTLKKLE